MVIKFVYNRETLAALVKIRILVEFKCDISALFSSKIIFFIDSIWTIIILDWPHLFLFFNVLARANCHCK